MKTILLLFACINFTHTNFTTIEMLARKITCLQKNTTLKNFNDFFIPKLLHRKFKLNLFFGHPNQTDNSFMTHDSVILTPAVGGWNTSTVSLRVV